MSTLAVVEQILRQTETPMTVREIVEHACGTLPTKSKTPDTVVARDLAMDIKKNGQNSLFIRTSPGRYALRAFARPDEVRSDEVTSVISSAVSQGRAPTRPAAAPSDSQRRQETDSDTAASASDNASF